MNKKNTRKCLVCKTRFEIRSNTHWICSVECARVKGNEKVDKKKAELNKSDWTKEKAVLKINTHSKEHKKSLQNEINKLARMIDAKFGYGCIDMCGKPYGKQIDGAHYHSRGGNCSLRYNLHNIHSADSQCNCYSDKHKGGYYVGLEIRYGCEYRDLVAEGLPIKYKELKLSNQEIYEKLAIVRKLIRDFKTFDFKNGRAARESFNNIIGIYN